MFLNTVAKPRTDIYRNLSQSIHTYLGKKKKSHLTWLMANCSEKKNGYYRNVCIKVFYMYITQFLAIETHVF